MTPFERLIAARPDPDDLSRFRKRLDRELVATWRSRDDAAVRWSIGPELSRGPGHINYFASYHSDHEGTFAVILHVRPGPPIDDDGIGRCELGTILDASDFYEYGADLAALRDAEVRVSWAAAQWVYAVAKQALVAIHTSCAVDRHTGSLHGALTARRVRLGLFHRPYAKQAVAEGAVPPPPVVFVGRNPTRGDDAACARELSMLAMAFAGLTRHVDATIDRLLQDPSPEAPLVLRDLLLERGDAVEALLRDRACESSLPLLPLADAPTIDDELAALWNRVIDLDPWIDSNASV